MSPPPFRFPRTGRYPVHRLSLRGLSLVELLLCISVGAILIALFFPALQKTYNQALQARCLGNLRAFGVATLSYAAENKGFPRHPDPKATFDVWAKNYLNPLPTCPLKGSSKKGFHYTGNANIAQHYPQLTGFPVPSSRIVLASERNYAPSFNDRSHLTGTIMGSGAESDDDTPYPVKPQYHGTEQARGLHFFFVDGHIELVRAVDNDFAKEPVYGPITTASARTRIANGVDPGYFYDQRHFSRMKAGTLVIDD